MIMESWFYFQEISLAVIFIIIFHVAGNMKELHKRIFKNESAVKELRSKLLSLDNENKSLKLHLQISKRKYDHLQSEVKEKQSHIHHYEEKVSNLQQELKSVGHSISRFFESEIELKKAVEIELENLKFRLEMSERTSIDLASGIEKLNEIIIYREEKLKELIKENVIAYPGHSFIEQPESFVDSNFTYVESDTSHMSSVSVSAVPTPQPVVHANITTAASSFPQTTTMPSNAPQSNIVMDFDFFVNCFYKDSHQKMENLGFGLDNGFASRDSNQTKPQESQLLSMQHCGNYMIHASQCQDANCILPSCQKIKKIVQHAKNCKQKINGECPVCKKFILICCFHAEHCQEVKCPLLFCVQIQKRRKQQLQRCQ